MQGLGRKVSTYSSSSARLSDSCLVQIMSCLVEVLGSFFRAFFVLLKVGDGDVGLLSGVEG